MALACPPLKSSFLGKLVKKLDFLLLKFIIYDADCRIQLSANAMEPCTLAPYILRWHLNFINRYNQGLLLVLIRLKVDIEIALLILLWLLKVQFPTFLRCSISVLSKAVDCS